MFCPNCGKGDQQKNAYCRKCGEFLPDFENARKRGFSEKTPEENIKTSLVLNALSSLVGIIMAILLYALHLGREGTHPIIFIAAALFTVIGIWQMINVFTVLRLKKHFDKRKNIQTPETVERSIQNPETRELLNEADFDDIIPASVTERTTKNLTEKARRNSS